MPRIAGWFSARAPSPTPTVEDDQLYDTEVTEGILAATAAQRERRLRLKALLTIAIDQDKAARQYCHDLVRQCVAERRNAVALAKDALAMPPPAEEEVLGAEELSAPVEETPLPEVWSDAATRALIARSTAAADEATGWAAEIADYLREAAFAALAEQRDLATRNPLLLPLPPLLEPPPPPDAPDSFRRRRRRRGPCGRAGACTLE